MTKVLSLGLALLCAIIMGSGSFVIAQLPGDPEFHSMEAVVRKGEANVDSLSFDILLPATASVLRCEAHFLSTGEPVSSECEKTDRASLLLTVRQPIPKVFKVRRSSDVTLAGNFILSFEYIDKVYNRNEEFSIEMPAKYLDNKEETNFSYTFSTTEFLRPGTGRQGRYIPH